MAEKKENTAGDMPARRFDYKEGMTEDEKKRFKRKTLMENQEVLYEDTYQTGTRCNLIFFTHMKDEFIKEIEAAYPGSKQIPMANKLKLELSDGGTVSVFPSGKIMIQGKEENLVRFQERFDQFKQAVMIRALEQMKIEEEDSETESQSKQKE